MLKKLIFPAALAVVVASTTPAYAQDSSPTTPTVSLPEFSPKPKYCLFFTVDGLDRDYISTGALPNVGLWQQKGAFLSDALNVYPTMTTPNMTSIVTGAYPITTGIGNNQVYVREENKIIGGPRFNKAVTIAEAFKNGGHSTAAVQHFMLENRGADRYKHTGMEPGMDITSTALEMLSDPKEVPTLMVVLYQTVDKKGHLYGQHSTGVLEEARFIDSEMARIVNRYKELGILKDTVVVISSDHGMSSEEKDIDRKALNDALASGGWKYEMLTSPKQTPQQDVDLHIMVYGNLMIYLNRPFDTAEKERLFKALQGVEGMGRIYDTLALRRMGVHPNAGDIIIEPAPGWWFGGGGGTHGRMRESDGYQMLVGAGIKPGSDIKGAHTVDIMPTVLKLFGLEIPHTVDGKVLTEALAN